MADIKIREYCDTDELSWLDLHASVMVDSAAWWIVLHEKPTYASDTIDLVAVDGPRLVGFVTFEINATIFPGKDKAFVWEFGVHRDYRGQGIGRKMIEQAHQIALERYNVRKSIWYSQDDFAKQYYEQLGMQEIERHWQFSFRPTRAQYQQFKTDGIDVWDIRGSCPVDEFEQVKAKYQIIEDDAALKPRVCIGYEYEYQI